MRTRLLICLALLMSLCRADEVTAQRYYDATCSDVLASDAQLERFVLTTEHPNELLLLRGDARSRISMPELVNAERVFFQGDSSLLVSGLSRQSIMKMKKVKFYATLRGEGLIAALPHTPFC